MTGHQQTDDAREARRRTYADFVRFPDDGQRHELIDGEHVVSPSPTMWHQILVQRLSLELGKYFEGAPLGWVFVPRLDCVFSFFDVVEPDLLVVLRDQRDIITKRNIKGAPAIVVEVLSPGTEATDLGRKRALYERNGVREYWIVDPEAGTIAVYRSSKEKFGKPLTLGIGDELESPLIPGFSVALMPLFKEL